MNPKYTVVEVRNSETGGIGCRITYAVDLWDAHKKVRSLIEDAVYMNSDAANCPTTEDYKTINKAIANAITSGDGDEIDFAYSYYSNDTKTDFEWHINAIDTDTKPIEE